MIDNELSILKDSVKDIKDAIIEKGVAPTGNITTYAQAIRLIRTGCAVYDPATETLTIEGI